MQKISRIYVGNYGIDMAWYDGVTLDMTDPTTGEPTDTILNLENGGGKTTLLSFVFSCFDTPVERFLKHIQNKNHRFGQYFARDGQPGVILIEWVMPPRTAGGRPYRLVIGQAVAVKSGIERDECKRIFFSFEAGGALNFESVPVPKLNIFPVSSMNDLEAWLHTAHRQASDFFHTTTQQDWQKHLREERMLDVDMLKLQVNFSAQEGGIDTGFLTFHSEPEFIRKFLSLTLDDALAASVRQGVVDVSERLRRKPHQQKCLTELTRLHASLEAFSGAADAYLVARGAEDIVLRQGAGLTRGLGSMAQALRQEEFTATESRDAHAALAREHAKQAQQHASDITTLELLQLTRAHEAALDSKSAAQDKVDEALATQLHVLAASAYADVTKTKQRLAEAEADNAAARAALAPWRDKVEHRGALLRHALHVAEAQALAEVDAADKHVKEAVSRLAGFENTMRKVDATVGQLGAEEARLTAQEDACRTALAQLVTEGVVLAGETSADAMGRHAARADEARKQASEHQAAAETHREQERTARRRAQDERLAATKAEGALGSHEAFLAEGEATQEKLSQLAVLRQAAEADTADPDSPALLPALERLILSEESAVAQHAVHLSSLHADRSAILDSGVAGASHAVNAVVAQLRECGVRSARPFNTYLAQALPDANAARALVVSNPARFLGVSVARSELARARELVNTDLALDTPVMVSEATLDPDAPSADRFVLPASHDAAFNHAAAQTLLEELETRVAEVERQRDAHADRLKTAVEARGALAAYAARFGGGALTRARTEIDSLQAEAAAAQERAQLAEARAGEHHTHAEAAGNTAAECGRAAETAAMNHAVVRRLSATHDAERPARLERLSAIPAEREQLAEQRTRLETERSEVDSAKDTAYQLKVDQDTAAKVLRKERLAVAYGREDVPADEELRQHPQGLDALRVDYADAVGTYESEAKARLGLLQYKESELRKVLTQQEQGFASKYASVPGAAYQPYLALTDFPAWIQQCADIVARAQVALREASDSETAARTERTVYQKANKDAAPATAAMLELDEGALADTLARTQRARQEANAAAQAAEAQVARYANAARDAGAKAGHAEEMTKLLRASLGLPDLLDAETVVPDSAFAQQAAALIAEHQRTRKATAGAGATARKAFDQLRAGAASAALQEVEPDIAQQLLRNEFEAACADSTRLLDGLADRIGAVQSSLDSMREDFDACLGELLNLSNSAITLLSSAATNKRVPVGAPYVGGKPIVKMRARFSELSHEVRRQQLSNYLDDLIESTVVPAKGAELVADAVQRIHGKPLGLQMLKMVPDEALQYVAVDKIQNSGGEGVVMAMFLYMLINQLRAETQAKLKKAGGGPLILDNPFAKATTPTLWQAQRLLAQAMDVQLIFATALPDYNTVGEFGRFVRLRKAGKNSKTGRWHLEAADFKLNEAPGTAEALV